MKIVPISHIIETCLNEKKIGKFIEKRGRTAYKSENKISDYSYIKFIKMLISRGHESVLEHYYITVKFITDRGVSHELVRHRIASYTQESTRFCNYSKNDIEFIAPIFKNDHSITVWKEVMEDLEKRYKYLISIEEPPQLARSILPNSLKTEIDCTMNLREWRHFMKERAINSNAHPQMRFMANQLLKEFKEKIPIFFEDFDVESI